MKKRLKKITSYLLVLTFVVAQLFPSIKVLADAVLEDTGLAVKIKDVTTLEFVNVSDSYTFNYNGNAISDYDLNVSTNNYELDNTNYLLVLDYEIYTINYDEKIYSDSIRKVLTKDDLGKISTDIQLKALSFNGKMPVSLKLYDITDIYDDFVLNGGEATNIDLTGRVEVLSKTFDIFTTGYTNDIVVDHVTYNTVPTEEEISYDTVNGYYEIDGTKAIDSPVKMQFTSVLGNTCLLKQYYVHYTLNGQFYGLDSVGTSNNKDLTILSNLVNGKYNLGISITDIDGKEIVKKEVLFNVNNSSKVLTYDDLVKDSVLLEDIISYNNLTLEEKSAIGLSDEEEKRLEEELKQYSYNSYLEGILNNQFNNELVLNSYNKVNNEELATLFAHGTLNHIDALDNRMTSSLIYGLIDPEMAKDVKVNTYLEDGKLTSNDTYLKTNMTVEFLVGGYSLKYKVALLGNLGSDEGFVKHDDIINIIDIAINSSNLGSIYHLVSDVNGDGVIDVIDVTDLMNLLKNGGVPFTSLENPILSNIQTALKPDKTDVRVGDEFELTLVVKNFGGNKISGLEGIINYDDEVLEVLSVLNINDWYGNINVINDDEAGKFLTAGYVEIAGDTELLTIKFRALKEGTASVFVDTLKAALNGVEVSLADSKTNAVTINIDRALSTNNNISKLEIDSGRLDKEFNKDVLTYTLYVGYYTNSINISGLLEDTNAVTSAFKEYTLTGYKTTIEIPVTAEDGSVKTYVINVVKVDNRSNNNYLSSIDIDGAEINFDKNTLEYNVTVLNNITELMIVATAEDDNADVTISGNTNFKVGNNVVTITVKAENGSVRTYKINVEREAAEELPVKEDNGNNTKLVLIILIIATIAALVFLIFKDNEPKEKKEFKLKDNSHNK